MKLLAELQKHVGAPDRLVRAWFTSFNTDIEFFETYVLPTVLGAEIPRSRLDYEHLQQELTARGIDLRIFCDPRFLETHRTKRTCIPVHGIRPQRSEWFSEHSLFHPKVIYLEDRKGRRVIGAGSANLTVSGWGRNLEAFRFFEVTSHANYEEIRGFFEVVCAAAGVEPLPSEKRVSFSVERESWRFVHSYQEAPFPKQLFSGTRDADLAVWSPYLPHDLDALLDCLEKAGGVQGLRAHLVADRTQANHVRTPWSEKLRHLQEERRLVFHSNPTPQIDPRTELRHAKVWKVGGRLAIGSWNFTGPGSNSLLDEDGGWDPKNNIEAGFIIDDRNDWRAVCGEVLKLGPEDCATPKELDDEGLHPAALPPFDLHVCFDWRTQAYQFEGEWLDGRPAEDYEVRLPGVSAPVALAWKRDQRPRSPMGLSVDDRALLRDRVFKVLRGGQEVQRGLVSELNAASRRAQHFASLSDLFDALVQGDDVRELDGLTFRTPLDTDTFADDAHGDEPLNKVAGAGGAGRPSVGYFRLFQSVQAFQQKLEALERLEVLDQLVFTWPGCLLELVDKVREELATPGREVFHWFLVHEVRWLCDCARERRKKLLRKDKREGADYHPVPEGRWTALDLPAAPTPPVRPDYLAHVRRQWVPHV